MRVSVVTPQYLLHAADVGAGPAPVLCVQTERVRGFLSVMSSEPSDVTWLLGEGSAVLATLPPPGVAEVVRGLATRRWSTERRDGKAPRAASFLLSGWGRKHDYGDVAFRYTVTNYEHDVSAAELGDVEVDDDGISADFATYGGDFMHRDRTLDRPYSITIAGAGEFADRLRDRAEGVARAVKKGRGSDDVAMAVNALFQRWREVSGAPTDGVLLARMLPDGAVEAVTLRSGGATVVDIAALGPGAPG